MTYSMMVGKYKLIFSDTHFKDFRKKPTISVYDADTNSETKIASFNSQETFEWFIEAVVEADRKTEPQRTCEECKHYLFTDIDGYYCEHETYGQPCRYEPKTEPQKKSLEQFRVGLEYHTDTAHFGKVKGESITTNKVEDEPQTERSSE